jgi:hypothetical protein
MPKLGDIVTWTSQANSRTTTKTGKIVARIPAGRLIQYYLHLPPGVRAQCKRFDSSTVIPRREDSFLVIVPGLTEKRKSTLYWPRTSGLTVVEKINA